MRWVMVMPAFLLSFVALTLASDRQAVDGFSVIVAAAPKGRAVDCEKGSDWKASFSILLSSSSCGVLRVGSKPSGDPGPIGARFPGVAAGYPVARG